MSVKFNNSLTDKGQWLECGRAAWWYLYLCYFFL